MTEVLTSAVIDLNAFVAMPAEMTGQWNGSVSAPMASTPGT